jgi:glycosyltransferase involved in cell wall biosynthesis
MTSPLVSVVIPAYNGGSLLRAAVDSVLAQTYSPIEVVVVDDGSEEDVGALLEPVADRIRLIRQTNAGTAAARNRGISKSRGDFIALLDQDDLWDSEKLALQMPAFDDAAVALVHSGARWVDVNGRVTSELQADPTLDTHALLADCRVPVQTVVIRRSALNLVGEFDESLSAADDWDMWIRFAERFRLAAVPHTLATIRVHPGNQSRNAELMYRTARQLFAKNRKIHGSCPQCRRALRRASIANRAYYYGRRREEARALVAAGHRGAALRVTARAISRNPRAVVTTPAHFLGGRSSHLDSAPL